MNLSTIANYLLSLLVLGAAFTVLKACQVEKRPRNYKLIVPAFPNTAELTQCISESPGGGAPGGGGGGGDGSGGGGVKGEGEEACEPGTPVAAGASGGAIFGGGIGNGCMGGGGGGGGSGGPDAIIGTDSTEPDGSFGQLPGTNGLCCHVDCPGGPDPECPYVCGNEILEKDDEGEPYEWCDGDCPTEPSQCTDNKNCTEDEVEKRFPFLSVEANAYYCATRCNNPTLTQCVDNDKCCSPLGTCTQANDNDCDIEASVGGPCDQNADCATVAPPESNENVVQCLVEEEHALFGGYCTVECRGDVDCPDDSHCSGVQDYLPSGNGRYPTSIGACVQDCSTDADCPRAGYECFDADSDKKNECWHVGEGTKTYGETCSTSRDCEMGEWSICTESLNAYSDAEPEPLCTRLCSPEGVECGEGYRCPDNSTLGPKQTRFCVKIPDPTNGNTCLEQSDCNGSRNNPNLFDECLTPQDHRIDGGYCIQNFCRSDKMCPEGNHCAAQEFSIMAKTYYVNRHRLCVPACESDADCSRSGHACFDLEGDGKKECWPAGTGNSGGFDDTCDTISDCGELGKWATCIPLNRQIFVDEATARCTELCETGDTPCPSNFSCGKTRAGPRVCLKHPETGKTGTSCTRTSGCPDTTSNPYVGENCLAEVDRHIKGGYCTYRGCNSSGSDPLKTCSDGEYCNDKSLFDGRGISVAEKHCIEQCDSNGDCPRDGFQCYDANRDGQKECWHAGTASGGDFGDSCEVSSDCGDIGKWAVCKRSTCTKYCGYSDVSCPSGYTCKPREKICVKDATAGNLGGPCEENDDCSGTADHSGLRGQCLPEDLYAMKGGYCIHAGCDPSGDDPTRQCAPGTHCTEGDKLLTGSGFPVFQNACLADCTRNSDCPRNGYTCHDANNDGTKECWHQGTGSTGGFGDACFTSSECGKIGKWAVCYQRAYCSRGCHLSGLSCPSNYQCVNFSCAKRCRSNTDCPAGRHCFDDPTGSGKKVCL